jgi:hypothetical protein
VDNIDTTRRKKMKLVHYSIDEQFNPEPIESVDGYKGCWFYECPDNIYDVQERSREWGCRTPHFFEIDDQYITEEQDLGSVIEYFVEADDLDKLISIDPELSHEL